MSQGPLRIVRTAKAMGEQTAQDRIQEQWKKLLSIAPAEVTGFYLTLRPAMVGNLTPEQVRADWLASWFPWICVVLAIAVKAWATHKDRWWKAQWGAVAISTCAFFLWVITMGHYMAVVGDWPLLKDTRLSLLATGLFTFLIPYFYKGDLPQRPPRHEDDPLQEKPKTNGGA